MSVEGVVNVAGFYRRRAGLIEVEEVDFGYDDAPMTAAMLVNQDVPSNTWWFAEIPYGNAGGSAPYRVRVFQLDAKLLSHATVERIHALISTHFGATPKFA